tara:strand:+ start:1709 stop:2074 length:366 start_codon:yes stop_codon:yes gene_type:complete
MMRYSLIILLLTVIVPVTATAEPSAAEGKTLYRIYCTQCHGIEGDGYGINVEDMEVLPRDHTDAKEMLTRTDQDLFKAIKHGGKAIDKSVLMPNWDANFSDEQIMSLVRYLRSVCCNAAGN